MLDVAQVFAGKDSAQFIGTTADESVQEEAPGVCSTSRYSFPPFSTGSGGNEFQQYVWVWIHTWKAFGWPGAGEAKVEDFGVM